MNIKLIYIGKNKSNNIELLVNEYEKKINHFVKFNIVCLKNRIQSSQKSIILKSETELFLKHIDKDEIIILLDEKGKEFSTIEFSKFVSENLMNRTKNLTFVIGGAYGFSKEIKDLFNFKISISKMTFSHDMARLFFTEQLYRSLTIINNIPYHNE